MKCWNCLKEIPDDAKSCQYCEQKQDRQTLKPGELKETLEAVESEEPHLVARLRATTP